jgi:hypothetical protein
MVYFDLALQTLLLHDATEKASMNHLCSFQAVAKSFWRTKQNPDVLNQSSNSAKAHKKNVQSVGAVGDLSNYLILNNLRKSSSGGDAQDMLSPILIRYVLILLTKTSRQFYFLLTCKMYLCESNKKDI